MQSAVTFNELTCVKILLIEDQQQDAELIEELLLETGHKNKIALKWVQRLGEALTALQRESFNLILVDLSLPVGRGGR